MGPSESLRVLREMGHEAFCRRNYELAVKVLDLLRNSQELVVSESLRYRDVSPDAPQMARQTLDLLHDVVIDPSLQNFVLVRPDEATELYYLYVEGKAVPNYGIDWDERWFVALHPWCWDAVACFLTTPDRQMMELATYKRNLDRAITWAKWLKQQGIDLETLAIF